MADAAPTTTTESPAPVAAAAAAAIALEETGKTIGDAPVTFEVTLDGPKQEDEKLVEKSVDEKPAEEKMADETPADKKPADEKPADDKQTDDKQTVEAPPAEAAAATEAGATRRKSVSQKLNRKGSKARLVHLDAKPGDHYFVKLKGYPAWPVVVCDEDMLPQTLLKTRPVTAARLDGTYREDYADGGRRAHDRTYPVMYLYTNEFGWVPNTDMRKLDPETVLDVINDKMRKDLQEAHRLAAEHHPLNYYKDLLRRFQEELEAAEEAKRLAAAMPKKSKKVKAAKDGDVDMLDVPADDNDAAVATTTATAKKTSKKRKADDDVKTPQRSDSVKKPKIKITSNGTPKAETAAGKLASDAKVPDEKSRLKEFLFLRHKIQKGLLTRDQPPKEEEMKPVSDYLTKLETFPDLSVRVIRETKINKVLKAILKIATIPHEDEYKFKPRSQVLLDQWNKLLAAEPATNGPPTSTNGKADAQDDTAKPEKPEKPAEKPAESEEQAKDEPATVETTA